MNSHGQIFMWVSVFISLGTYPGIYLGVESLGDMVTPCFSLVEDLPHCLPKLQASILLL